MAIFSKSLDIVLKHECGDKLNLIYTKDPRDAGGETYMGISRKYNHDWAGWAVIDSAKNDADFPSCLVNIDKLNDLVYSLYKEKYWDRIKGDLIENQLLANKFFDAIVQPGFIAIKIMQESILDIVNDDEFDIDGIVGRKTIAYLNKLNIDQLLDVFRRRLKSYYTEKAYNPVFIKGWLKRAES